MTSRNDELSKKRKNSASGALTISQRTFKKLSQQVAEVSQGHGEHTGNVNCRVDVFAFDKATDLAAAYQSLRPLGDVTTPSQKSTDSVFADLFERYRSAVKVHFMWGDGATTTPSAQSKTISFTRNLRLGEPNAAGKSLGPFRVILVLPFAGFTQSKGLRSATYVRTHEQTSTVDPDDFLCY